MDLCFGTSRARALGVEGRNTEVPDVTSAATILVVEDDPMLRAFYRNALTLAGYTVIAVEDGIDALRRVESAEPDLVLLDMDLPRLHGRDVKDELKAHAETRHIPILVISGSDTRGLKDEVDCVMRKPVTFDRLIAAVESCLRSIRGA